MTITPQDLVRREVHYCVSSLVHTLAQGHENHHTVSLYTPKGAAHPAYALGKQAWELTAPVPDYEEAAREAGWRQDPEGRWAAECADDGPVMADTAEEACAIDDIEPYHREVYEHWIVSDWLAGKLAAKGEKVDYDFAGLTVWARTTTGQAISVDWVIEQIVEDLNNV